MTSGCSSTTFRPRATARRGRSAASALAIVTALFAQTAHAEQGFEDWLDGAYEHVQTEISYAAEVAADRESGEAHVSAADLEILRAIALVRYVSNRMSPARYGGLSFAGKAPVSTWDAIQNGAGLCGNHAEAAIRLARRLGLEARAVQFYRYGQSGLNSHIVVEIFAGGAWRFFDVSYRTWFLRRGGGELAIASYEDIAASGPDAFERRTDEAALTLVLNRMQRGNVFEYLSPWPQRFVLVDMGGEARFKLSDTDDALSWDLRGVPNYVGRAYEYGRPAGAALTIALDTGGHVLKGLEFRLPSLGCGEGWIVVRAPDSGVLARKSLQDVAKADGVVAFSRPHHGATLKVSVESKSTEVCHMAFAGVSGMAADAGR